MIKVYLSLSKYLTVLLVCGALSGFAQERTVSGKVTASDDASVLPGVNIIEKGTTNGTVSDSNGEFRINVAENATLVFSFIGYKPQEVSVGSQTNLAVVLQTDVTALSEVVVVGYGTQEKKDVTGSVVTVGTENLNRNIMTSPQDMMLGKVAGVQITSADGAPDANSTIKIRGTNSLSGGVDPLIVIDGFPVDNSSAGNVPGLSNALSLVNPNDIESFTVLKDASATAIYGLRAANGVIIITTKKGKEGKPQFTINSTVSVSTPQRYFGVLTGDQMRSIENQQLAAGTQPGLTQSAITNRLGTANTDWQKQIYQAAVSNNQNLSMAGTYKNMPYRVSYGYTDQEGLLKTTNNVRNSININLTPSFFQGDLQVAATFKGINSQSNFGNTGAIGSAIAYDPTQPVYNGNTKWGGYTTWVSSSSNLANGQMDPNGTPNPIATANPVALLNQTDNRGSAYVGIGNLKLDYRLRFFPAIKLTMNAGFDYSSSTGYNNNPNNAAFTAANGYGSLNNYTGNNRSRLLDLYANYAKTINKHKFDVTAGYSYQSFEVYSSSFIRNGQNPPIYQTSQAETKNGTPVLDANGNPVQVAYQAVPQLNYLVSFFARANYSFADKYLVSLSLRDDASSRFAKQNQFIIFPSAAVGWRINKESFMQSVKVVSDLKLRGSYGITGNQNINLNGSAQNSSYPYLGLYQQGTTPFQYQFGSGNVITQRPQAYDANIKWETTAQADIGIDYGFLDNRITGTVDVYQKNTTNLLNQVPAPLGSNFTNSILTNVGSMTNKGIEFAVNALVIKHQDFQWNFGFNIAHSVNQITKLLVNNDPNSIGNLVGNISGGLGGQIQNQQVGYPINSYFVFQQVYSPQGKPIEGLYVDQTGKGGTVTGNNANRIRFHSPNPTALMGINSRFNYKKFDLYLSGHAVFGNYVYNNNQSSKAYYSNMYYQSGYFNNVPSAITDANFVYPQSYSSYYVQNATFFRMDNINLGYNLGEVVQKLKARISFTVQNAFFITKYKGVDPEVNGGIDNNIYPRPRVYMLGVNLTW